MADTAKQRMERFKINHPNYKQTKRTYVYSREKYLEYYAKNKDKKNAQRRLCRLNNIEKHRLVSRIRRQERRALGRIIISEWIERCESLGNKCQICNKTNSEVKLTIDHIIPIKLGGTNEITNLQPLCLNCNSRKGKRVCYNMNMEL